MKGIYICLCWLGNLLSDRAMSFSSKLSMQYKEGKDQYIKVLVSVTSL